MTKTEMAKAVVEYFQDLGRVPSRGEYMSLGNNAPVHYRILIRNFGSWHSAMKRLRLRDVLAWDKIFDPSSVMTAEQKPVLEPASEEDLSPLEKLRSIKGESIE
jgi:hypothetical protein